MAWSITIGTVKGTVICLHITFLLFLLWIAAAHYAQGGWDAAVAGVVFITLLFLCVLLHEFGHIFAARRYGVQTPDVILLPIGGVARLQRFPEEPAQEIVGAGGTRREFGHRWRSLLGAWRVDAARGPRGG